MTGATGQTWQGCQQWRLQQEQTSREISSSQAMNEEGPSLLASPIASPNPAAQAYRPPKTCSVLKCNNALNELSNEQVFWLVGTAHVSRASCDDVRDVILAVQPEVVLLELCAERKSMLTAQDIKAPSLAEALAEYRAGHVGIFQALYGWFLGQAADQLEVLPGEEFRVAVEEARKINAKVVLGDRPLQVTLARLWARLSAWDRVCLVVQLLFQGLKMPDKEELQQMLEEMKETDVMTAAIEDLARTMPAFKEVLISERDLFMTYMLRKLSYRATRVVAVVGAGHLAGIRESWEREIDVAELMTVPEKKQRSSLLASGSKWVPRASALLGVAAGGMVLAAVVVRWRRPAGAAAGL